VSYLNIKNLQLAYGNKQVVKDFDLSLDAGEIVALFGPSGCGKTTVLKALAGILSQAKGSIELAGQTLLNSKSMPTELREIGLIFQDYALFPHLTVSENVAFGLVKMTKLQKQSKINELLSLVNMLDYAKAYPGDLSGGQQQRVAIARAMATQPKLMLFDESFSNLDPQFRFELITEMRSLLKAQGTTALFVTHNQDEAFAFCDRIAVMNEGKIEQIDAPEPLFSAPKNKFVAEFLGPGVWMDAKVETAETLSCPWGELPYAGQQNLESYIGQTVSVYLRPHQIGLTEKEDGLFYIETEHFVGELYQSVVHWHDQSIKIRTHSSFLNKKVSIRIKQPVFKVY
jgi:iron(III) transport system ATP-binding protein